MSVIIANPSLERERGRQSSFLNFSLSRSLVGRRRSLCCSIPHMSMYQSKGLEWSVTRPAVVSPSPPWPVVTFHPSFALSCAHSLFVACADLIHRSPHRYLFLPVGLPVICYQGEGARGGKFLFLLDIVEIFVLLFAPICKEETPTSSDMRTSVIKLVTITKSMNGRN